MLARRYPSRVVRLPRRRNPAWESPPLAVAAIEARQGSDRRHQSPVVIKPTRAFFVCKNKHRWSREAAKGVWSQPQLPWLPHAIRAPKPVPAVVEVYLDDGQRVDYADEHCPVCGLPAARRDVLKAQYVADIPCGGACRHAKGPNCDCSCGGENHGKG